MKTTQQTTASYMALTSYMINNLITPYHNYTSIPQNNIWTHFPWSISASMKKIAILELAQLLYFILILSWRRIISEFFAVQYEILETQLTVLSYVHPNMAVANKGEGKLALLLLIFHLKKKRCPCYVGHKNLSFLINLIVFGIKIFPLKYLQKHSI